MAKSPDLIMVFFSVFYLLSYELLLLNLFCGAVTVSAAELWSEKYYRASDATGELTADQQKSLDENCIAFMKKNHVDLALLAVTAKNYEQSTLDEMAQRYWSDCEFGYGETHDGYLWVYEADAERMTLYSFIFTSQTVVPEENAKLYAAKSVALRQVISQRTSSEMMEILEDVVASGTGSNAYVSGYRVAGKTGTSETLQTQSTGRYIASFIGIAPADDPEIVVLVMLDHPDVESGASGGRQAAPTVGKIIEKTLEYMGVARRYTELDRKAMMVKSYVPDLSEATVEDARILLKRAGLVMEVADLPEGADVNEVKVAVQVPEMGQYITEGSTVIIYTDETTKHPTVRVPDLTGYALTDAYILLNQLGLNMHAENIGTVVSQSIEPGTMAERGAVIDLKVENTNTESMG